VAWLLNVVYLLLLLIVSPWLCYQSIIMGKYRRGWPAKLLGAVPTRPSDDRRPCFWLHAVSVGEVNLLEPVLRELRLLDANVQVAISTTTDTGYALARTKYPDHRIFYCPLDFSWATRRAMRRLRPDLLVLVELELWPNLMQAAKRHGAKIAVINGRLSDNSFRGYRRLGKFYRNVLSLVDWLGVQNDVYADRFLRLGANRDRLEVTGSVKYDGAETDRLNPTTKELYRLAGFAREDVVLLAGSTQAPEEAIALDTFAALSVDHPWLRLVLVPRHPDRFGEVEWLLRRRDINYQLRSRLEADGANGQARVLLVDTVGELAAWWGTADIAFVGGSFGNRGGQNMIEPAAYGIPVCFGPRTRNFRDVVEGMIAAHAAEVVGEPAQLTDFVRRCLENPEFAAELGHRAQRLVQSQLGAARRTAQELIALSKASEPAHRAAPRQPRSAA